MTKRLLLVLPALAAAAPPLAGQFVPDDPSPHTMEVRVRERWLHGRERAELEPFAASDAWIGVDSAAAGPGRAGRTYHLRLFDTPRGTPVRIVAEAGGRVSHAQTEWPEYTPSAQFDLPGDSARFIRSLFTEDDRVALPPALAWELVPAVPRGQARPGVRWTDTLDLRAERDGFLQELRGPRVSTFVRDTVVGGRRLWIVRDSARVRYRERWLDDSRTLDTLLAVERTAAGVVTGRHLYDPALALFLARADTTALAGEAVLTLPDGRSFRTPARYERRREWVLHDSAAHERRLQEIADAEAELGSGGIGFVRVDSLGERLQDGDPALLDSLVGAWLAARDPDERARVAGLIEYGREDHGFWERWRALRLQAGDTAGVIRELNESSPTPREPFDARELALFLPLMANPGAAFDFGLDQDVLYEEFQYALEHFPPAVVGPAGRACTPDACEALAAQWERATEPRLRDLGLFARVAMEPARWADTVLARVAAGSVILRPAAELVMGVGATYRGWRHPPLPAPGAHWRAWLDWVRGVPPADRPSTPPERLGVPVLQRHANALRFHALRTGRDVSGELRGRLAAAESDSARLVFGAVLNGLGELPVDADAVARGFLSSSAADRTLAARQLYDLFASAPRADEETAAVLVDRLLGITLDGAEPFPGLEGVNPPYGWAPLDGNFALYLPVDSLPAAIRAKWAPRARPVPDGERGPRSLHLVPWSVQRAGRLVRLGYRYFATAEREEAETPMAWAGTLDLYLLEKDGEWVLVAAGGSIT